MWVLRDAFLVVLPLSLSLSYWDATHLMAPFIISESSVGPGGIKANIHGGLHIYTVGKIIAYRSNDGVEHSLF